MHIVKPLKTSEHLSTRDIIENKHDKVGEEGRLRIVVVQQHEFGNVTLITMQWLCFCMTCKYNYKDVHRLDCKV